MDNSEKVTISRGEYNELLKDSAHLNALEINGVDNWEGYVGRYVDCEECGEENTWADDHCTECGATLPEP